MSPIRLRLCVQGSGNGGKGQGETGKWRASQQRICNRKYQTRAGQTPSKMHAGMSCVCARARAGKGELEYYCSPYHRNKKFLIALSHTKLLIPMTQPFITALLAYFRATHSQNVLASANSIPGTPKHPELKKKCHILVK